MGVDLQYRTIDSLIHWAQGWMMSSQIDNVSQESLTYTKPRNKKRMVSALMRFLSDTVGNPTTDVQTEVQ